MNVIKSIQKNISTYLLHTLFVSVVAPILVIASTGLIVFFTTDQEFSNMITSIIIGSAFGAAYGSIISLPLSLVSILIFKLVIDRYRNTLHFFVPIGAFFGFISYTIFIYFGLGAEQKTEVLIIFLSVGSLIGLILHHIWKDSYIKFNRHIKSVSSGH